MGTPEQDCLDKQQEGGWWEDRLAGRCAFPIAPVNTWTNLAYVAAGALVALARPTAAGRVEGALLVVLGLASGAYHGLKTRLTGALDDVGMYLVFGALAAYVYAPAAPWAPAAMLASGVGLAAWRLSGDPAAGRVQHALLGAFAGGAAMADALAGRGLAAAVALGLLAAAYLVCWEMDRARTFPLPRWGHGLWHVLTAAGTALLFLAR